MDMDVVGSRGGPPGVGAPSSCYLVRDGVSAVMLDCGHSSAGEIGGVIDPGHLDGIFLSHMHGDHVHDVPVLGKMLLLRSMRLGDDDPRIPLYLPEGGADVLRSVIHAYPQAAALTDLLDRAFAPRVYEPGRPVQVGTLSVTPMPVVHAAPCCGFRVSDGEATLAYSGDTGMDDAVVDLAQGSDSFLCEATYRNPDTSGHGHLSAREAGEIAHRAGVGQLLLTHLLDVGDGGDMIDWRLADADDAFPGPVAVASPRVTYPVVVRAIPSQGVFR